MPAMMKSVQANTTTGLRPYRFERWPMEKWRYGETEHEEAHHQASLRGGDAECGTRSSEGWQAHVDAKRREGDEKAQQNRGSHGGRRNAHASNIPWLSDRSRGRLNP